MNRSLENRGKEEFQNGNFPAALTLFDQAISLDSQSSTLFTNRGLVNQKMNRWPDALRDAVSATRLDANLLAGHIIKIESQIELELFVDVANSIEALPISLQKRSEVLELKVTAACAASHAGNAHLADEDFKAAIQHYTIAIQLDDTNHLFYFKRNTAYQKIKSWENAVKDAEKVCSEVVVSISDL